MAERMRGVEIRTVQSEILVEWEIKWFMHRGSRELTSDYFYFLDATWNIAICPNGKPWEDVNDNCVWLFLKQIVPSAEGRHIIFRMGIKKPDGSVYRSFDAEHIFDYDHFQYESGPFLMTADLMESWRVVSPDNVLRIFCFARLFDNGVDTATQILRPDSIRLEILAQDLSDLCCSGRHSDVTIKVQGQQFQAHKSILSARSTVFSSMFDEDTAATTTENLSGVIEITDCDPDAYKNFLLYLYSGKMNAATCNEALLLYKIADKYDLQQLKAACVDFVNREISRESFYDVTLFAVKYNDTELLETVKQFFIENLNDIFSSTDWQSFFKNHTTIANDLLISLGNSDRFS